MVDWINLNARILVGWMQEFNQIWNFILPECFRKQNFQEDWVIRLIEEQAFLYGPSKFHYKSLVCSIWISETIAWLCSCCQIEFCIPYCRVWSFIFHLKFKIWGTLCFLHMKILEHIYLTYVPMMCRLCTEEFKSHAVKKEAMVTSQGVVKLCWCKLPA